MSKKKPVFNMEMACRGALRRLFARSPMVIDKNNESRQEFPKYKKDGSLAKKPWVKRQCEKCGNWEISSKMSIDHIDPVVPPDGFSKDMDVFERINEFNKRLWCKDTGGMGNLQRICDTCHDAKTYIEKIARLTYKYTEELNEIEKTMTQRDSGEVIKELNKYISKKKVEGFKQISQRASNLKDLYLKLNKK